MGEEQEFGAQEAREIGAAIGIDWDSSPFDVEQFRIGLGVELEHGRRDPRTRHVAGGSHQRAGMAQGWDHLAVRRLTEVIERVSRDAFRPVAESA